MELDVIDDRFRQCTLRPRRASRGILIVSKPPSIPNSPGSRTLLRIAILEMLPMRGVTFAAGQYS